MRRGVRPGQATPDRSVRGTVRRAEGTERERSAGLWMSGGPLITHRRVRPEGGRNRARPGGGSGAARRRAPGNIGRKRGVRARAVGLQRLRYRPSNSEFLSLKRVEPVSENSPNMISDGNSLRKTWPVVSLFTGPMHAFNANFRSFDSTPKLETIPVPVMCPLGPVIIELKSCSSPLGTPTTNRPQAPSLGQTSTTGIPLNLCTSKRNGSTFPIGSKERVPCKASKTSLCQFGSSKLTYFRVAIADGTNSRSIRFGNIPIRGN